MTRASPLLPAAMVAVLGSAYALNHVFLRGAWIPFVVLCVIAAFAIGALARRLDVPAVLSPAISLVGLVVVAGAVYQADSTILGIPTLETLRLLGDQLREGFADIRALAAPVASNDALHLVTGAGVFLVAMVVDLVVFTARRPVGAGLPLLILYIVPASMRDGIGAVPFVIASLSFVGLLVAEGRERARGWGRRLIGVDVAQELVDTSPVSRVGRRLGLAAVSIALVAPAVVPDLGQGLIDTSNDSGVGFGDGPSTVSVINPYVQLQPQLRNENETTLLRVRTANPQYLRLTSLDRFDGAVWSPGRTSATKDSRVSSKRDLPDPKGLDDNTAGVATARVDVVGLKSNWLPVPYAPQRVDVDGDWRYLAANQTIFSTRTDTQGIGEKSDQYDVTSVVPAPDVAELVGAEAPDDKDLNPYLQVPELESQLIFGELQEATQGARTPYEKVLAVQNYFQSGRFAYDLEVDALKQGNDLDNFLRQRRGYCEQFAATMAYMVRLLKLPARVAIGFTPGSLDPTTDDVYVITNKHAHAWPEVYFEGAGWLRFEPTPRSDERAITVPPAYADTGSIGSAPDPSASAAPSVAPSAAPTASTAPGSDNDPTDRLGDDGADATAVAAGPNRARRSAAVLLGLAILGAAPAAARHLIRRGRARRAVTDVDRVHVAWAAMTDDAEDAGFALRAADTPRRAAARLVSAAQLSATAADALHVLARAEERARYAPTCPDPAGLDQLVTVVRRALVAHASRGRRVRIAILPASTGRHLRRGGEQALTQLLSRWDSAVRAVVRRLRPRRPVAD
ncbi:MAG TPA: DUF3488 and transglutaminase-like domain-containing protein [Mycobacteriales bacterium]|nr:DUF3488 and transglutaminase-like domain-containing protein [Mycobacteriales bacterium]